jgi:DNA repair protein RadD|nr:MAG TPA: Chromatin remodeling complex ATPase [Caudoviricetes sp.]
MKYTLRENQKQALDACLKFLSEKNPGPGVVVAPTGYGKSILIGAVADQCNGSVIVLQPSIELLKQNLEKYESYGNSASVYSASAGQKEIGHVTFATIGSVKNLGSEFRKRGVKVLLVDECHASYPPEKGSMFRDFVDDLKPTHIIGFTATPFRLKTYGEGFNNWTQLNMLTSSKPRVFDKIIHVTQIQELVKNNFWAKLNYELWDFNSNSLKLNSTGAEYTEQSVQKAILEQGVNENVYKRCKKLLEQGKNAMVFMDSVENAKILAERLGSQAACVYATMGKKERDQIVEDFKNNKIKIVTNQSVLTCLSKDTEILTNNGWKDFYSIEKTDLVAQFDKVSGKIDYDKPLRVFKKKHSGNMVTLNSKRAAFRVTDDHEMLKVNNRWKVETVISSSIVNKPFHFPVSGHKEVTNVSIPQEKQVNCSKARFLAQNTYNYRKKGIPQDEARGVAENIYNFKVNLRFKDPHELSVEECLFIGFFIGDGSINKTPKRGGEIYSLVQSLKYPRLIAWFEGLLKQLNIEYNSNDRIFEGDKIKTKIIGRDCYAHSYRVYNLNKGTGGHLQQKNGFYRLKPYMEKDGSPFLRNLNKEQFLALFEGLYKANGYHGDNRDTKFKNSFVTGNKKLADLIQEIGVTNGVWVKVTTIEPREARFKRQYRVSFEDRTTYCTATCNPILEKVENEEVWCVTMPKSTIITRYKGKVTIMGNCGFDKPDLQTVIMARPTNSLALLYQIFGRGVRNPLYPNLKECLIIDFCNNVKRFGRIEELRVLNKEHYGWGVFNNTHLLTGVPMGAEMTMEELEKVIQLKKEDIKDYKLTFGIHKGKRLSETPEQYRVWLVKNIDSWSNFNSETKTLIKTQCMMLQGKDVAVSYDPRSIILFDLNNIAFTLYKAKRLNIEGLEDYMKGWSSKLGTSNVKVVCDSKRATYWRKRLYNGYKENRKTSGDETFARQMFALKDELKNKDYFLCFDKMEADDIIAEYAKDKRFDRVTCISADSDFNQLFFFSRFRQISPLKREAEVVSKRTALSTLISKVVKGDDKDNIKKSHSQKRISSEVMSNIYKKCYEKLVEVVKSNPNVSSEELPLREIIWNELKGKISMNRQYYDLNFTLINLIQNERKNKKELQFQLP